MAAHVFRSLSPASICICLPPTQRFLTLMLNNGRFQAGPRQPTLRLRKYPLWMFSQWIHLRPISRGTASWAVQQTGLYCSTGTSWRSIVTSCLSPSITRDTRLYISKSPFRRRRNLRVGESSISTSAALATRRVALAVTGPRVALPLSWTLFGYISRQCGSWHPHPSYQDCLTGLGLATGINSIPLAAKKSTGPPGPQS